MVEDLTSAVNRFFASDGPLVTGNKGKLYRSGQHTMAVEVASAIESGTPLVIEAGTGIGKTFAYLTPLILGRGKAIVATATKTLQDQLLHKDIPQLQSLMETSVKAVALKGRSSYVCVQRLETAMQSAATRGEASSALWDRIETWSRKTLVGDIVELDEIEEGSQFHLAVTSTRENCLGGACPHLERCHVNRARREALSADLVVVNHHLFFADLQIREAGVAELLPNTSTVVFDEAHQLNDIGLQFLGQHLTATQVGTFLRDASKTLGQYAAGCFPWSEQLDRCDVQISIIGELAARLKHRSTWKGKAPEGLNEALWERCMETFAQNMSTLMEALRAVAETALELRVLLQRGDKLLEILQVFSGELDPNRVRWLEPGRMWRMVATPLDIAQCMHAYVFGAKLIRERKAWIFTSATLGTDAQLSWFTRACGLSGAKTVRLPSPFNFDAQSAIYIPEDLPAPGDAAHSAAVAQVVAQAAIILDGKTLVLATTLKAMQMLFQALSQLLDPSRIEVLVQGQAPKRSLLARFQRSGRDGCLPAVLVASGSFWEGIDIPGSALQLVVIDKLPFAPPDDPIQRARALKIEAEGLNSFKDLHLVHAAVGLRQGAGRLIRSETDRGILMVGDRRLLSASYGKTLLSSLPAMKRLRTHEEFIQACGELPELPPRTVLDLSTVREEF